jgi:imidazolonepropionase-like amidohydrolase
LTINAARVAGLGNRVGALTPGSDADIVVFSKDPLRLDARVLEVWVGGKRVHRAEVSPSDDDEDGWKAW